MQSCAWSGTLFKIPPQVWALCNTNTSNHGICSFILYQKCFSVELLVHVLLCLCGITWKVSVNKITGEGKPGDKTNYHYGLGNTEIITAWNALSIDSYNAHKWTISESVQKRPLRKLGNVKSKSKSWVGF